MRSVCPPHRGSIAIVAALAAWVSMPASSGAAKTDITVDYDKTFTFDGLRTWMWHPDGAGEVRLASASADPKRIASRVDPVIVPAIERELASRGFARSDSGADLYIHYYVLGTVGQSRQTQGQFVPAVPDWGLPPFVASTSALSIYPIGTLIIDIASTPKQAVVWRGSAARDLDFDSSTEQRHKVLDRAIRDLIRRFPPKK